MTEEEEVIKRGTQAKELLDNPLLKETLSAIEEGITSQWAETTSPETREELWYTLKGYERFKSILETAVESGKAQEMLKEKYQ